MASMKAGKAWQSFAEMETCRDFSSPMHLTHLALYQIYANMTTFQEVHVLLVR